MHADLNTIQHFAGIIHSHWMHTEVADLAAAGAAVEAQLDGTQPADLIVQAVALAQKWQRENDARRATLLG